MTDKIKDNKVEPDTLELRAKPKPVTRISRKVLLGGSALVLLFIAGAVMIALDPPDWKSGTKRELYQTKRKATPDGLEKLPSTYDRIPKLGPPGPGDIGRSLSRLERDLGIRAPTVNPIPTYRPDREADFRRAERIRLARKKSQAQESGVFFTISRKRSLETTQKHDDEDFNHRLKSRKAELDALTALTKAAGTPPNQATTPDPGGQKSKLAFLQKGPDADIYNKHSQQTPVSPYQLMAGTIIPASLVTGLNSDLPGMVIAQVTENVFDTVTGRHLLIPQGTRLIGKYDSVIAFGQERSLVIWQRIIRPDGSSIVIDNLPATDSAGYAGLSDKVNLHTWKLIKGIALSTLLGVGTELTFGNNESDLVKAIRESTQKNTNHAGQKLVDRALDIQPTITVRPGWPLRVIVNRDIVVKPYIFAGK